MKDRVARLLEIFRKQNTESLKKSGKEEQFGRLEELLVDLDGDEKAFSVQGCIKKKKSRDAAKTVDHSVADSVLLDAGETGKQKRTLENDMEILKEVSDGEIDGGKNYYLLFNSGLPNLILF